MRKPIGTLKAKDLNTKEELAEAEEAIREVQRVKGRTQQRWLRDVLR
jgi:hypothetical protein